MWCTSARKPFPAPVNAVSKNLTWLQCTQLQPMDPLTADLKNLWSDQDKDQIKCLPYITPCHFQKFIFVKFLQGVVVTSVSTCEFEPRWMKTFHSWGLKTKNKRTEWYQLMHPVMMHALLHRKSYTRITLTTTERDLYSTVLITTIKQQ
jgi:hypothetical protein